MANNFIDAVSQAQVIATQMSNETLLPLRPNYIFDGVAKSKEWNLPRHPTKGDTLSFPVLGAIAANTAALDPTAATITGSVKTVYTRRNVSLSLYGDHATMDTLQLEPEAFVDNARDTMWSLTDQALNSMNLLARAEIDGNKYSNESSGTLSATYHYYASDGTASTMGPLKAIDVRKVVADMLGDNVQKFANGNFVCILGQNQATQLRAETGNAAWGAAVLAGDESAQRRFNGSIGTFEGVEFVVNNQIIVDSGGGTAACYFLGADGVGKAIGKELSIAMSPTPRGNHDNLLLMHWESLVGYKVIRRESIRVVSSTNTQL
jgi:N4-gp56 family major capsid protein